MDGFIGGGCPLEVVKLKINQVTATAVVLWKSTRGRHLV